ARSSPRENPPRTLTSGASTSVAIVKRAARKSRGEAEASASLTTTKLTPHTAAAVINNRSARRRVTPNPASIFLSLTPRPGRYLRACPLQRSGLPDHRPPVPDQSPSPPA